MRLRTLAAGIVLWAAGTVGIRLAGQHVLRAGHAPSSIVLYVISFALLAFLVPGICGRLGWERPNWFEAASVLMLPTLVLDPFSSVFFSTVFPNVDPAAAGVFGGWMLICCAGAVAGVWMRR